MALPGGVLGLQQSGLLLTATLLCSLCDHWDFLPGLLHGPLQLPIAIGPEAAIWQMQVSSLRQPLPGPNWPLADSSVFEVLHTASPGPNLSVSCFLAPEAPGSASMIRGPPHSSMALSQSGTAQAYSRCSLSACQGSGVLGAGQNGEVNGLSQSSHCLLLGGFPLSTFHSRADRPTQGLSGVMWVLGRGAQQCSAGLGHVAGCTGGSGLEVPCCQELSLVLTGQMSSYSRI